MVVGEDGLYKSDRTRETQAIYQKDIESGLTRDLLDEPALIEWTYWRLIVNRYPYDARWMTSMLIVYKKKARWEELPEDAVQELHEIKNKLRTVFDKFEENGYELASVQNIPHVHCLKGLK